MKTKFDSDENLSLNKIIEIPIMTIVVRVVFHENNKYYPQVFFNKFIQIIKMLYYDRTDASEGIDANKTIKHD